MEKFINPFTDFGFKKIFGEESNKDLLIDFLNALLDETIQNLTFLTTERLGVSEHERNAIFDLYCENERGEKFIVELQKAKQIFFKERSLYYSTFAIQEQATKGKWNFRLQRVFSISIMDFVFENGANPDKYLHNVQLIETETSKVFNDKLRFVYLEMPKFKKTFDELTTKFDKWMYFLKNLVQFDEIPQEVKGEMFLKLFQVAEIAKYNRQQRMEYYEDQKILWDNQNVIDTAVADGLAEGIERGMKQGLEKGLEKGLEQGLEQGRVESKKSIAANLKKVGVDVKDIATATGLSIEEIENLG